MTTTITQVQTFTNNAGRTFAVRLLPHGARYGLRNSVVNDKGTLVEFYDTTFADDGPGAGDGFGPLGQFVSRYFAATLLGMDRYSNVRRGEGLCLDGGNPQVWSIDGATMGQVTDWITRRYTIVSVDGKPWEVDYHPVLGTGTVQHDTDPATRRAFRTVNKVALYLAGEAPDPDEARTTLDRTFERVLDRVSAWLGTPAT